MQLSSSCNAVEAVQLPFMRVCYSATMNMQSFGMRAPMKPRHLLLPTVLLALLQACTPTVQVAMPTEPITINLNVRIEHEIRVKVEKELDDIFSADSGLF